MRIKEIKVSPLFKKHYKKLSEKIKQKAKEKEKIFRENFSNPILKTHKLSGKNKDCWSFRIDYSNRIKFIFLSDEEVLFLDIGAHEIYK